MAVETYKNHKDAISAAILGLIMPGMDGEETFHEPRKINTAIKVISASRHSWIIRRCRKMEKNGPREKTSGKG